MLQPTRRKEYARKSTGGRAPRHVMVTEQEVHERLGAQERTLAENVIAEASAAPSYSSTAPSRAEGTSRRKQTARKSTGDQIPRSATVPRRRASPPHSPTTFMRLESPPRWKLYARKSTGSRAPRRVVVPTTQQQQPEVHEETIARGPTLASGPLEAPPVCNESSTALVGAVGPIRRTKQTARKSTGGRAPRKVMTFE
ncbi:hypothetical protein DAEQUDRAFT_482210 [Daedalea quercina L-15889]|uniref:Uncharacterized protein n=1 Tax=Daedalea quercina L-15889 TaxID=1314783 RepID=A0A165MUH6_9APHY|nr:hypothetical protein DAEQUDRAFT_482210 [Daedalea quercina L-15889]